MRADNSVQIDDADFPPTAGGRMDLRPRLWAIVAAILLTALSPSVGSRASHAQAQSAKSMLLTVDLPERPAVGAMVFDQKGCARCHAIGTEGSARIGPDLGRVTFVGLAAGAPDPVVFEPGSPRRGRDLFASKGCKACHAVAGDGGHGGPDLGARGRAMARSVSEIAGMMWNHTQQMDSEFARREVVRPGFSGQEMADVIAYLYFVNYANVRGTPFRGGQIFTQKCASCHMLGRPGIGPDLLSADGLDQPIGIIASMWNHATSMESQSSRRGRAWPRLERGETADLAAFLISRRAAAREPVRNPKAAVRP